MDKNKIEKELSIKSYYAEEGKVYFLSINNYAVYLPEDYYFKRKEELRKYFSNMPDLTEVQKDKLVLENLSLFAKQLPKEFKQPKVRYFHQTAFTTTIEWEDYPEELDCKDVDVRGLRDPRTGELVQESAWKTERNNWVYEFALSVRDKLRKIMT